MTRSFFWKNRAANAGNASASSTGTASGGSRRLAQQQAQVDEVVDIMRQNIDKVLERDKNLSSLDDRAGKWAMKEPSLLSDR